MCKDSLFSLFFVASAISFWLISITHTALISEKLWVFRNYPYLWLIVKNWVFNALSWNYPYLWLIVKNWVFNALEQAEA